MRSNNFNQIIRYSEEVRDSNKPAIGLRIVSMSENRLRLEPWTEVRGILDSLDEDALYATISGNTIAFPAELIAALKSFLGKRVAVLRTDDQFKPYRWRLLD